MNEGLGFEWLSERHLPSLVELFERDGSPCYCRYWHFDGDGKAWQLQCMTAPETNRQELEADVEAKHPRASGLVALDGDRVVAFMKLVPRALVPKIASLRTYRAYDLGPDDGVWSIGCFLVDAAWRKRGLTRALVGEAKERLRALGARALEAYPREGLHPAEAWTGPPNAFEGFEQVAGEKPYPVVRLLLARSDQ